MAAWDGRRRPVAAGDPAPVAYGGRCRPADPGCLPRLAAVGPCLERHGRTRRGRTRSTAAREVGPCRKQRATRCWAPGGRARRARVGGAVALRRGDRLAAGVVAAGRFPGVPASLSGRRARVGIAVPHRDDDGDGASAGPGRTRSTSTSTHYLTLRRCGSQWPFDSRDLASVTLGTAGPRCQQRAARATGKRMSVIRRPGGIRRCAGSPGSASSNRNAHLPSSRLWAWPPTTRCGTDAGPRRRSRPRARALCRHGSDGPATAACGDRADELLRRRLFAVLGASTAFGPSLVRTPQDWRLPTRCDRSIRLGATSSADRSTARGSLRVAYRRGLLLGSPPAT